MKNKVIKESITIKLNVLDALEISLMLKGVHEALTDNHVTANQAIENFVDAIGNKITVDQLEEAKKMREIKKLLGDIPNKSF